MKLIDSEKLLAAMSARYDEKKHNVPDTLAEGFMQMDKLIHEQDVVNVEEIRADAEKEYNAQLEEWKTEHTEALYRAEMKGRADAIEEVKSKMISFHTDAIFQYGADIIEAKSDAFDELKDWLKEQNIK